MRPGGGRERPAWHYPGSEQLTPRPIGLTPSPGARPLAATPVLHTGGQGDALARANDAQGPSPRGPPAPGGGEGRQGPARSYQVGLGLKTALSLFSALKSHRFLLENVLTRVTGPNRLQGRRQSHKPAGQHAHHYLRHRSLQGCTFP